MLTLLSFHLTKTPVLHGNHLLIHENRCNTNPSVRAWHLTNQQVAQESQSRSLVLSSWLIYTKVLFFFYYLYPKFSSKTAFHVIFLHPLILLPLLILLFFFLHERTQVDKQFFFLLWAYILLVEMFQQFLLSGLAYGKPVGSHCFD